MSGDLRTSDTLQSFHVCLEISEFIRPSSSLPKSHVSQGGNITRSKASLKGSAAVPKNKACRKRLLEIATAKAADMTKENPVSGKKAKGQKEKKAHNLCQQGR